MDEHEESVLIHCPICKGKTGTKVYKCTVLLNFPLYCPKCKKESIVNVVQMRMKVIKEPDA